MNNTQEIKSRDINSKHCNNFWQNWIIADLIFPKLYDSIYKKCAWIVHPSLAVTSETRWLQLMAQETLVAKMFYNGTRDAYLWNVLYPDNVVILWTDLVFIWH